MADITQSIEKTIKMNERKMIELTETKAEGTRLRALLNFKKVEIGSRPLSEPRTVYADPACVEYKDDGHGTRRTIHKKPYCHDACALGHAPADIANCKELMGCAAFSCNNCVCTNCNHRWQEHLHIYYELCDEYVTVKDSSVEEKIKPHAKDVD
jgi:hypothetical protein